MRFKLWLEMKDESLLHKTEVTEHGVHFKTGQPVTFSYLRATEKAPNMGSRFGQDIEPAGRYMVHNPNPGDMPPEKWETGTVTFKNPLVIAISTDEDQIYGPGGWKARLSQYYGNKKGMTLTQAIKADGYDGIVTTSMHKGKEYDTREIVDLRFDEI